ncbi:MAG: hypothetical protein AAFP93_01860, partial [Bacteroidota bacterium]
DTAQMGFLFIPKSKVDTNAQDLESMLQRNIMLPSTQGFHNMTLGTVSCVFYGPVSEQGTSVTGLEDTRSQLARGQSYDVYCCVYTNDVAWVSKQPKTLDVPKVRKPNIKLTLTAGITRGKEKGILGISDSKNGNKIVQLDLKAVATIQQRETIDPLTGLVFVKKKEGAPDPKQLSDHILKRHRLLNSMWLDQKETLPYIIYVDKKVNRTKSGKHSIKIDYKDFKSGEGYQVYFWAMDLPAEQLFLSNSVLLEIPGAVSTINQEINHQYDLESATTILQIQYASNVDSDTITIGDEQLTRHRGIVLFNDIKGSSTEEQLIGACERLRPFLGTLKEDEGYVRRAHARPVAYFWGTPVSIKMRKPYPVLPLQQYQGCCLEAYTDAKQVIKIILLGGDFYTVDIGSNLTSSDYGGGAGTVQCDVQDGRGAQKFTIYPKTGVIMCKYGEIGPTQHEENNEEVAKQVAIILATRYGHRYANNALQVLNSARAAGKVKLRAKWDAIDWNMITAQQKRNEREERGEITATINQEIAEASE